MHRIERPYNIFRPPTPPQTIQSPRPRKKQSPRMYTNTTLQTGRTTIKMEPYRITVPPRFPSISQRRSDILPLLTHLVKTSQLYPPAQLRIHVPVTTRLAYVGYSTYTVKKRSARIDSAIPSNPGLLKH